MVLSFAVITNGDALLHFICSSSDVTEFWHLNLQLDLISTLTKLLELEPLLANTNL